MANDRSALNKTIIVLGLLALGAVLILPFYTALTFAAVTALILYKPYLWLRKKVGKKLSAGIMTGAVAVMLFFVVGVGMQTLLNEFARLYQLLSSANLRNILHASTETITALQSILQLILQKVIESLTNLIYGLPKVILSVFIYLVSVFFLLCDGHLIYEWVERLFPLPAKNKAHMFRDLKKYAHSFVTVWLVIGIIQGLVAGVGMLIFKLPAPLIAGVVAALLSILPIIGVYAFYIPVAAVLFLQGEINTAIGLATYGLVIGSILDYGVRPYYAGKWSAIHPLFMLLSMIGGLILIGPAGLILGPSITIVALSILHSFNLDAVKCNEE